MRIKAVPAELMKAVSVHPYLYGGAAAIIIVGGYLYLNHGSSPASQDVASNQGYFSYGMPMVVSQGGGGGSGVVDSITAPSGAATGVTASDVLNRDLFNFEVVKETHDFSIANRTLDTELSIAATNADIAMAGINSANFGISAGIANTFIRSGQMFSAGSIGNLTFAMLGTGTPQTGTDTNARRTIEVNRLNFLALLNNSTVKNLIGNSNGSQPVSGSVAASPYGGTPSYYPGGTVGSISATPSIPSNYPSSPFSPASYVGANQTPAYGGGGGGSASSFGTRFAVN